MTEPHELPYTVEHRRSVAKVKGLKVTVLTLAKGEEVPWHSHSFIDDDFFCMKGPMVVETRQPDVTNVLNVGETIKIKVGQPHRVTGWQGGPCCFLLVQGIGPHDFIPE